MAIQDFNLASLDGRNGFRLDGAAVGDNVGNSVSNAGDINGDGFDDVIVGGAASYVLFGQATGFDATLDVSILDGSNGVILKGPADERVGYSVSSAGDVNGDGFDDVIVGSPSFGYGGDSPGFSYVVFGRASGFDAQMDLSSLDGRNGFRLEGENPSDYAGTVSSAGDINGDGFDDVVIGAFGADSNGDESGASYVVFGRALGFDATMPLSGLDGSNGFRLNGNANFDHFGSSVSGGGDVNGDGFDDLIIGAKDAGPSGYDHGYGYVILGNADGFGAQMDVAGLDGNNGFRLVGERNTFLLGLSVSGAGDINGDGFADLIIGARNSDSNLESYGSSYVLFGKAGGFGAQIDLSNLDGHNGFRLKNKGSYSSLGESVSAAGDVNGDGLDDLIVGDHGADTYHQDSGASYVLFGRTDGFDAQIDLSILDGRNGFRLNGENLGDYAGDSVSGAGDVNNDGFDDLIVGAPAEPNRSFNGMSYIIFGGKDVTGNLGLIQVSGTASADHIQGTVDAEYLSAGAGDDTLTGGGGADKLDGGDGDDVISLTDLDFAAIDGGAGNDTLRLTGSSMNLDSTQPENQIYHVETIDLGGTGANSLTMTANLIPYEFFGSNLTIQGNQDDRVRVLDAGWTDQGIADGYHNYANPLGTLHVQDDVQVEFETGIKQAFHVANLNGTNGFRLNGEVIGERVGESVSNTGDINGDGFDDLIVSSLGSSYVVFGRASGFDADMNLSDLDGSDGFSLNGMSSSDSNAGDVNGDGIDDFTVGNKVVFGNTSGFGAMLDVTNLNGSNGFSVTGSNGIIKGAGDVNDDGLGDVIVGSGNSSYVVFGKTSGFDPAIDLSTLDGSNGFRLDGERPLDNFGVLASGAGDVNGDGIDDVLIGAFRADPNGDYSGSSYVVFGKDSGFDALMDLSSLDGSNGFRLDGESENDRSGGAISAAGDINGDGFDDVIIGAPYTDSNQRVSGSSYVVFGKASGFDAKMNLSNLDGSNGFRLDGEHEFHHSGSSVSGAGDVNGDGYDDLIIGSYSDYFGSDSYVVFGKASGFDAQIDLSEMTSSEGFQLVSDHPTVFGSSVSGAGDINGDGLDDLIVGAPYGTLRSNYYTAGKSYIIFGSRDFGNGGGGGGELPEIKGTDGDDTLKGSDIAEHFIAGDGNDNLFGRGGADVFDAGAGDDAIRIGDLTFASIDGGDGNDALHLTGADLNLDLTTLGDHIHGIETICLYGRGDNTLTLNADSLLNLNTLKVHGNSGDHITFQDSGWVDGGSHGFYHTYTHDDAVLLVGTNVTVDFV